MYKMIFKNRRVDLSFVLYLATVPEILPGFIRMGRSSSELVIQSIRGSIDLAI